jgi:hypothetical protein
MDTEIDGFVQDAVDSRIMDINKLLAGNVAPHRPEGHRRRGEPFVRRAGQE